jgi:riboflavin kinase / FMN adenylyltransferase
VQPRRHNGSDSVSRTRRPSLVVIGNFDGVHRGHRAVIESALRLADAQSLRPLVLTFHPHPAEVLGRGARPVLTTIDRKVELLLALGERLEVVVEPFTLELSKLAPEDFVEQVLVQRLDAKMVIVGENFRFGHQRAGDLPALRALGERFGFEAHAEPLVGDELGLFSSTRAREALEAGDLPSVERCLGRPHSLSGRVVHGAARGRTIGFPTANLAEVAEATPPYGVYACRVQRELGPDERELLGLGVLNLGVRPTVQGGFSVEVHLLDFSGDLYEAHLRLELVAKLRDEQRFPGIDALKAQIARDVEAARALLKPES